MRSSSTSSSERLRTFVRWARDLVVSGVLALLLFEGVVAVLGLLGVALPSRFPKIYAPNARFVFAGEYFRFPEFENEVELNADGFHDWPRACPKPEGIWRVAVWGDSMVEGFQVPRGALFTSRLQEALSTDARPVEVMNLGFSGGRVSTLLDPRVQEHLAACGVDALLVEVHGAMELPFQAGGGAGGTLPLGWSGFPRSRLGRLREELVTRWGLDGLYLLTEKARMMAGSFMSRDQGAKSLYDATADRGAAWGHLEDALRRIRDGCETRGVRVALFYVPAWPEVTALRTGRVHTLAGGTPLDYEQLGAQTARIAAELSLPLVDLADTFATGPEATHFESDRHWTALGQERVAGALLPFIRRTLIEETESASARGDLRRE